MAEWAVFALGLQLIGFALPMEYIWDYAWHSASGSSSSTSPSPPCGTWLWARTSGWQPVSTSCRSAFEVGLFGWMAIMQLVLFPSPHLSTDHAAFW